MNYINELKEILKLNNIYVQLTLKTILCILIIYIIEKIEEFRKKNERKF